MEQKYVDVITTLTRQYYEKKIAKDQYRIKRKILLDHMEDEFNGGFSAQNTREGMPSSFTGNNRD